MLPSSLNMTGRVRQVFSPHKACETLWSNAPPSFLAPSLRSPFSVSSAYTLSVREARIRNHDRRDAYTLRQAQQRKDANLSRRALLREQVVKELGDPIRGIDTPFVQSFDSRIRHDAGEDANSSKINIEVLKANPDRPPRMPSGTLIDAALDHGINHEELATGLRFSRMLTEPLPPSDKATADRDRETAERLRWEARDQNAAEAVQRIVSLANGSSMHRTKKNIERIVDTFGRHNTDKTLRPKAAAKVLNPNAQEATPRAGPDTGSSEVQIGILTAKIRVLADRYEGEARQDKINKRNLRLLLHRRQKLLKYMERKERGSERWTNMLQTLGLTPATWRGEIAVE